MVKETSSFICQNCSYSSAKWMGKCPECQEWNSFEEEVKIRVGKSSVDSVTLEKRSPKKIKEIEVETYARVKSGINEFDRVVGGGLVIGSLTLIGGNPGIGKSTLLLEVCGRLAKLNYKLLYVSGEESSGQIASRCKRLGITSDNLLILHQNNLEEIKKEINSSKPTFLVIDSIQTTHSDLIQSPPGTMSQIREVTYEIMNLSKAKNITTFIIGHVTKEGSIAGPKLLEHMVDTVIYFEGDQLGHYRMLRVNKNRFGNTNEVGIFEMSEEGLKEITNPSKFFLEDHLENSFGKSLTCIYEGSRPLLLEIQALTVDGGLGNARRTTQGLDGNRLAMLVAIVEKYFGIVLVDKDIYVNVVGGIKLQGREADLAIIASILSSLKRRPIEEETIFIGEVGLTGEVRSVPFVESRIRELQQLGYKKVITSFSSAEKLKAKYKIAVIGIKKASELEGVVF